MTTGRGVRDTCALWKALPELLFVLRTSASTRARSPSRGCTTLRGLVSYTVPKIDVQVSANARSVPNAALGWGISATRTGSLNANAPVPNTGRPAVARPPAGQRPGERHDDGQHADPGVLYGARITQVDMRFGKIVRFKSGRAEIGIDLYNVFNANTPTTFLQTFDYATSGATYLRPTAIVSPRFARFNVTVAF